MGPIISPVTALKSAESKFRQRLKARWLPFSRPFCERIVKGTADKFA